MYIESLGLSARYYQLYCLPEVDIFLLVQQLQPLPFLFQLGRLKLLFHQ